MSIDAMKLALEALQKSNRFVWHYAHSRETTRIAEQCDSAITAIKQALAEPVAWQYRDANDDGTWGAWLGCDKRLTASTWREVQPLYTTPPAAPVPLTDEQKVLRSLLGAALGALRYHTEQTRPIQRTNETITAIEHELAAHGITEKGQPC